MGRTSEAPPNPSAKDVEQQDPVQLPLDKHKKLKLDKDQITALALDTTRETGHGGGGGGGGGRRGQAPSA